MTKLVIILAINIMFFSQVAGQNKKDNIDFIIVIDGNIASGSIMSPHFKVVGGGKSSVMEIKYYPGNLSLDTMDYSRLMSKDIDSIYLVFTYYQYVGQKQLTYNYEIELKKEWLKDYFDILHIYNLDKKVYKKVYAPISRDKNYTYDFESPSHTFLRVQKSATK